MQRRWISPRECSEYLACHLMTVYAWIAAGRIPVIRLGRSIRVDLKSLEADLNAQVSGKAAASDRKGRAR
jgi:excisionase family DNA binding protein